MFICIHFVHGNSSLNCNTFQIYDFFTRIGWCNRTVIVHCCMLAYNCTELSSDCIEQWAHGQAKRCVKMLYWSLFLFCFLAESGIFNTGFIIFNSFDISLFLRDLKHNLSKIKKPFPYALAKQKKWQTNNWPSALLATFGQMYWPFKGSYCCIIYAYLVTTINIDRASRE